MANIGACFIKLGQFEDAITSYEHIMNEHADFKPGFNLILCYYAIRDAERMRKSFLKLLNVASGVDDEKYTSIRFVRYLTPDSLTPDFWYVF